MFILDKIFIYIYYINLQLIIFKKRYIFRLLFTVSIIILMIIIWFKYIIIHFLNLNLNSISNIKVCLCTLGKKENRYIKEFVQYYENIGIDKIFLYDNNDINDERFEEIIDDYIKISFVKIMNWRGKTKILLPYLNDCYKRNYKHFDWIVFFEIDEYVHLKNYNNIKQFLNNPHFNNCQAINLNWFFHTDNNLIYYDNRSLHERFPEVQNITKEGAQTSYNFVKSILKGNIPNLYISNTHYLTKKLKSCNGFGKHYQLVGQRLKKNDFEYYYIDHYYSKSLEEYVQKINKGCAHFAQSIKYKMGRINIFFAINKITLEKINFIEKNVDINLSYFRKKIKYI